MNESSKKAIIAVIQTLDQIPVSGKDNLNMLLASIMTLENLLKESNDGGDEIGRADP